MIVKETEKSRILKTKDYHLFKICESFKFMNDKVNILIEEMEQKNISKDYPILVDDQYNILDGRYRYKANMKLDAPIYYKIAEVSDMLDVLKAQSINRQTSNFDFLIYHQDKLFYREVYEWSRKINEPYTAFIEHVCKYSIKNGKCLDRKYFKNGTLEWHKEFGFKANKIHEFKEMYRENFEDQASLILTDVIEILERNLWMTAKIIDDIKDLPYLNQYKEFYSSGHPDSESIINYYWEMVNFISCNHNVDYYTTHDYHSRYTNEIYEQKHYYFPLLRIMKAYLNIDFDSINKDDFKHLVNSMKQDTYA